MFSMRSAHYFDAFVEQFMPELPGTRVETAVENVLHNLIAKKAAGGVDGDGN